MAAQEAAPLQIDPTLIGELELDTLQVPYVNLEEQPYVHTRLLVGETEYTYDQSFPVKGHSAVMPDAIAEVQADGRQPLVAERGERYYVYLA